MKDEIKTKDERAAKAAAKSKAASEAGREGMRRRWGEHGPTKCVRAYVPTVERFRAAVPAERDRADAATAALEAWLNAKGAPNAPERTPPAQAIPCRVVPAHGAPITIAAVLTYHWYDEIEAGRKRTEYRDIGDYWDERLWSPSVRGRIAAIRFSRGYTQRRMTWEVTRIDRNEEDGVYEIHLGKRIA